MSSGDNVTLNGVTVLSDLVLGNSTLPVIRYAIDIDADLTSLYSLAIPFIFLWLIGIGSASYFTDDDGYVVGTRTVESRFPKFRLLASFLTVAVEGLQIAACALGPAATKSLMGGAAFLAFGEAFLFNSNPKEAFAASAAFQVLMMMSFAIPLVLWLTLSRNTYKTFNHYYVEGPLGFVVSFLQDCYILYFPVPLTVQLLRPIPCVHYLTGEQAIALDGLTTCDSRRHRESALAGGVIMFLSYVMAMAAGTVPVLVQRHTDQALNGRFVSISYAIKVAFGVTYVVAARNHRFYHLGVTLFLQLFLVFVSISLRPSLVERINFHRTVAYAASIVPTVMCLVAAGLDDPLARLPLIVGIVFFVACFLLAAAKYYFMVCGKLFPAVAYLEGSYEGDLCLGTNLPHGHGSYRWALIDKVFTGRFFYGRYEGYGVIVEGKKFFQGTYKRGLRDGFGMTNNMPSEEEESYEGFWALDKYHGDGTKKFCNGDTYVGPYVDNLEHGEGTWTFETTLGPHSTVGLFVEAVYTNVILSEDEIYEGERRFGVPHGEGTMTIGEIAFEGEWRAGKLHGYGTVQSPEGHYEGHFFEGKYHDDGTWSDARSTYAGKFREGLKHGHGREEDEDGVYEGNFGEGERNGYGTFQYSNGARYQGSWLNGEYHSSGNLKTDEFEFDGQWQNGKRHGARGHIIYTNGEEYIGGWYNDTFHDQGILRLPGLGQFHGKFDQGNKVGLGRFTFIDGSEYIGEWKADRAGGEGEFTFSSRRGLILLQSMDPNDHALLTNPRDRYFLDLGGVYKGTFEAGQFSGKGAIDCQDGTRFEGTWNTGLPHGEGTLTFPGGGHYRGEWANGHREGYGVMVYVDRRLYEGEWSSGRRHGHGVLRDAKGGIIHDCEWVGDIPLANANMDGLDVSMIPVVDAAELLRQIMPSASSATEVDEGRERKRIEFEELSFRVACGTIADEQLGRVRILKGYCSTGHTMGRLAIVQEELTASNAVQKAALGKILNLFKAEFKAQHDRDPKKSDLVGSKVIAPLYKRYMELK